jgi:hypothetical protein
MSKCANPDALIETCIVCKSPVYTCELEIPINYNDLYNDYRCPAHPEGIQVEKLWFCGNKCYYDYFWDKPKIKINFKK